MLSHTVLCPLFSSVHAALLQSKNTSSGFLLSCWNSYLLCEETLTGWGDESGPGVTADHTRSALQSGPRTAIISSDAAGFSGLRPLTELARKIIPVRQSAFCNHDVGQTINHLNAAAKQHKHNPGPKWTWILDYFQCLFLLCGWFTRSMCSVSPWEH